MSQSEEKPKLSPALFGNYNGPMRENNLSANIIEIYKQIKKLGNLEATLSAAVTNQAELQKIQTRAMDAKAVAQTTQAQLEQFMSEIRSRVNGMENSIQYLVDAVNSLHEVTAKERAVKDEGKLTRQVLSCRFDDIEEYLMPPSPKDEEDSTLFDFHLPSIFNFPSSTNESPTSVKVSQLLKSPSIE